MPTPTSKGAPLLDVAQFVVRSMIDEGQVSSEDFERAQEHADRTGTDVEDALVALKIVTGRQLAIARARICEYPYVDLDWFEIDFQNALKMPKSVAERLGAFPLFILGDVATVAMEDPLNLQAIDEINQLLRRQIEPIICDSGQLTSLINRAYSLARTTGLAGVDHTDDEELTTGEEPIVAAVNQIIAAAIDAGASDVHINPDEHTLNIRYRIDGVLQSQQAPDLSVHPGLIQRLKVMSQLDLTQTRRPQDGKFRFTHADQTVDVRLSLLPTVYGENAVLRLLRPATAIGSIHDLGMPAEMTAWFERMITKPHGMILVTGPTGSGKTTTLYTALSHINSPSRNIMTIEDPVEIRLPMIRQIQANHEIGFDFAKALRSILRQDPDVILVGEIRDEETAKIAVQASLTGHLVFSTLHTNDAVGSIARLRDFGLPAFAINNALLGVIAQRLARCVCEKCVEMEPAPEEALAAIGITEIPPGSFVRGRGCPRCMNTGYHGRLGVFEMLRITAAIKTIIEDDGNTTQIRERASVEGMRTMLDDGITKAQLGLTSIEELAKLNATIDGALMITGRAAA
ncbi:MAG: GspE/PulE family protein [Phycisphaerales bacterium]